jgi:hypothetical protein
VGFGGHCKVLEVVLFIFFLFESPLKTIVSEMK